MQHEKIIKREDGSDVKITASLFVDFIRSDYFLSHNIMFKDKGNRKFVWKDDTEATPEEIYQAKLELWEKLKPTL